MKYLGMLFDTGGSPCRLSDQWIQGGVSAFPGCVLPSYSVLIVNPQPQSIAGVIGPIWPLKEEISPLTTHVTGIPDAQILLLQECRDWWISSGNLSVRVLLASPLLSQLFSMDTLRMGEGTQLKMLTESFTWTKDEADLHIKILRVGFNPSGPLYSPETSCGSHSCVEL